MAAVESARAGNWGFAIPMAIGTSFGLVNFIFSLVFGPGTKGTEMVPDLVLA